MPIINMRNLILVAVLSATLPAAAQDVDSLAAGVAEDLKKATAELTQVREQVEAERVPLSQRITGLEQKLADKKAEYAKALRFQENQLVELNALKAQAKLRSDEVKFIDSLLTEYAKAFRSRLNFVEEPRYQAVFDEVEKGASAADASVTEKFVQRSKLLGTSLERVESALGGEVFEAKALDKSGRVLPGKAALVGPVATFASTDGQVAGLLQQELNKADPSVIQMDKKLEESSRALVTSGKGQLALDATLGNAFKLAALKEPLYERLAKGGVIMIPLLGLGLAAVLVALFKWAQLSRIRLASEFDLRRVLEHLERGERDGALTYARSIAGPAGELLMTAIENVEEKKEHIEEVIYEKLLGARIRLERGIPFLALAATTGPLMGLLGTVMGMIATFKLISSFGSGDPKQLAAGISEALICTATGMAVAIPSLLFHAFLSRKAKGVIGSMEQVAVGFINGVPENKDASFV